MWTLFGALAGGCSPQTKSTRRSRETASSRRSSRTAKSARCLEPPSSSGSPFSRTSSGPRIRNSGTAMTLHADQGAVKRRCILSRSRMEVRTRDGFGLRWWSALLVLVVFVSLLAAGSAEGERSESLRPLRVGLVLQAAGVHDPYLHGSVVGFRRAVRKLGVAGRVLTSGQREGSL